MAETNGEKLLSEMDQFLTGEAQKNASAETAEDDALPFETIDDYSTAPVEFNEMALKLMAKVDAVFELAVKYNRHSSAYLKTCSKLEKGIIFLARCCRTKYALENHKHKYPELGQLSTDKLYRMTSFHFRKIDRALTEYMEQKQEISDELMDMQFRYFNLLDRLRATEVKISRDHDNCFYAEHENYDATIHGLAFSPDSWTRHIHKSHNTEPAAFNRASAFSPLKSSEVRGQSSNENSVNKDGKNKKEEPSVQTDQNSGLTSKDPGLSAQVSFEKQAKLNTLSDIEKIMYTAATQNPEELEEMRAKLRNVGYCCLHEAEIRAIRKVLDIIDST